MHYVFLAFKQLFVYVFRTFNRLSSTYFDFFIDSILQISGFESILLFIF